MADDPAGAPKGAIEVEYGKLGLLVAILASATALLATGRITEVAGMSIISAIVGYVVGNGRIAQKGEVNAPMFGRRHGDADVIADKVAAAVLDQLDNPPKAGG